MEGKHLPYYLGMYDAKGRVPARLVCKELQRDCALLVEDGVFPDHLLSSASHFFEALDLVGGVPTRVRSLLIRSSPVCRPRAPCALGKTPNWFLLTVWSHVSRKLQNARVVLHASPGPVLEPDHSASGRRSGG